VEYDGVNGGFEEDGGCKQGGRAGTIRGCEAAGGRKGQLCRQVANKGHVREDGAEEEVGEDGDAMQECVDDEVD
jgi:hypothetical protein